MWSVSFFKWVNPVDRYVKLINLLAEIIMQRVHIKIGMHEARKIGVD